MSGLCLTEVSSPRDVMTNAYDLQMEESLMDVGMPLNEESILLNEIILGLGVGN